MNRENNYRFWLSNTIEASVAHASRLGAVCGCRLDADAVARYITDLAEKRRRGEHASPFPAVIRGRLRDVFQPKHLMLKLACVRDAKTGIDYEFLIEYGIFESSTGIYFGIKAVADSDESDDAFIASAREAVKTLAAQSPKLFSNRRLRHSPPTDNADNGTFWPLWMPSADYENLGDEIKFLQKIYRHFIKSLPAMKPVYDMFDDFIRPSSPDGKALTELSEKIASVFGSEESADVFRLFIDNAVRRGILTDCGNGRWRFDRHWATTRRGRPMKMTKKAAFDLITVLFAVMARQRGIERKRVIPWKQIREVLLDSESQQFDSGWQHQTVPSPGTPYYAECEALCRELIEPQLTE